MKCSKFEGNSGIPFILKLLLPQIIWVNEFGKIGNLINLLWLQYKYFNEFGKLHNSVNSFLKNYANFAFFLSLTIL